MQWVLKQREQNKEANPQCLSQLSTPSRNSFRLLLPPSSVPTPPREPSMTVNSCWHTCAHTHTHQTALKRAEHAWSFPALQGSP